MDEKYYIVDLYYLLGIDFDYEKEFYERTFGKKVLSKGK